MKRFHVHVGVIDLKASIHFYSALFGSEPAVSKEDYAKWMLDDPRVNFAISTRAEQSGLDHLGIQAETQEELEQLHQRLAGAELPTASQTGTSCCYAKSDKHWTMDPQNIAWESFHTLGSASVYGEASPTAGEIKSGCCIPLAKGEDKPGSCCVPTEQASAASGKTSCCA